MIKAKLGDSLRSKMVTAMINESLAEILCHDVSTRIQSHYELGIEAKSWETTATEEPEAILSSGQELSHYRRAS